MSVSELVVSSLCRLRARSFVVSDECQFEETTSKAISLTRGRGAQERISGSCGSTSILFSPSSSDLGRVAGTRVLAPEMWDLPEGGAFVDTELIALSN